MSFSALTDVVKSSWQRSSRGGTAIDHIILHHCASTNVNVVLNMMLTGSREVSANYVTDNDGTIYGVVDEQDRAWTSASSYWDGRSITFECVNSAGPPDWPQSEASYEAIARMCADISNRYGFPLTRDGRNSTVLGHRELYQYFGASYATGCPGGMNMDRIVERANQILSGQTSIQEEDEDMKLFHAPGGTIALIGEITNHRYSSMSGASGFSIEANKRGYGGYVSEGMTEDVVLTLGNEALARKQSLVNQIVAQLGGNTVDTKAIAAQVADALRGQLGDVAIDDALVKKIAGAVDGALADNFAAVPDAVTEKAGQKLAQ